MYFNLCVRLCVDGLCVCVGGGVHAMIHNTMYHGIPVPIESIDCLVPRLPATAASRSGNETTLASAR